MVSVLAPVVRPGVVSMDNKVFDEIVWCSQGDPLQRLVYGVSHDMGAPLRSIIRFSELLQQRLAERLTDKEKYWLELMCDGGLQAQQMVDSLLQYSRLHTVQQAPTRFSLKKILDMMLLASQRDLNCKDADIHCLGNWPEITANEYQWRLLLGSIVDNALRYQPHNAPDHRIRVEVSCELNEQSLWLQVDDNGIGVSDAYLAEISRPFMRAVNRAEYAGLGMGLSYCERIAQLNHGNLGFAHSPLGGLRVIYQVDVDAR